MYAVCLCVLLACISACETVGFYSQAISGQLGILSGRNDINQLLLAGDTDAELKARLRLVQDIRRFAELQLGLPVGKSYSSYVDLGRTGDDNFVVWNVFAAPELSLEQHNWCYPLIGCAAYRGYFSRDRAERYAQALQHQGLDTHVGGVRAYSTLGWFADPVLSTFVHFEDARLAALLFHELAHKVIYIRDDTEFNESFATAVEQEGLRRWLESRDELGLLSKVELRRQANAALIAQVGELRDQLASVYQNADTTQAEKLQAKSRAFTQFIAMATQLHPSDSFRRWAEQLRNNASLVPIQSYNRWQMAFAQLLVEQNSDLPAFFLAVEKLGKLNGVAREQELQKLTDSYAIRVQKLTHE